MVWIVIAPQEIIDPYPFARLQTNGVVLKCCESLATEVFAGQHWQLWRDPEMMLFIALVHDPKGPGEPANAGLDRAKFELRKTFAHARSAELHDRLDRCSERMPDVIDNSAAVARCCARILARANVKTDRH